jgi:hypothetical protein
MLNTKPAVDLCVTGSPPQSELEYPARSVSSLQKVSYRSIVPLRYENIRFTTAICARVGFIAYRLIDDIAKAILGRVPSIAYIRVPTTN